MTIGSLAPVLLGAVLIVSCGGIPTDPTPSRSSELVVDVHAHAFTALHLPISGFVASYVGDDERIGELIERLALLQSSEDCRPPRSTAADVPGSEECASWLELARAEFLEVLRIDPDYRDAARNLENVRRLTGRP